DHTPPCKPGHCSMTLRPPSPTLLPYTTLFRSVVESRVPSMRILKYGLRTDSGGAGKFRGGLGIERVYQFLAPTFITFSLERKARSEEPRLNSSHQIISYAVFCFKKKRHKRGVL